MAQLPRSCYWRGGISSYRVWSWGHSCVLMMMVWWKTSWWLIPPKKTDYYTNKQTTSLYTQKKKHSVCVSTDPCRGRCHRPVHCPITSPGRGTWRRLLGRWVQGDDISADLWPWAAAEPVGEQPPVTGPALASDERITNRTLSWGKAQITEPWNGSNQLSSSSSFSLSHFLFFNVYLHWSRPAIKGLQGMWDVFFVFTVSTLTYAHKHKLWKDGKFCSQISVMSWHVSVCSFTEIWFYYSGSQHKIPIVS